MEKLYSLIPVAAILLVGWVTMHLMERHRKKDK